MPITQLCNCSVSCQDYSFTKSSTAKDSARNCHHSAPNNATSVPNSASMPAGTYGMTISFMPRFNLTQSEIFIKIIDEAPTKQRYDETDMYSTSMASFDSSNLPHAQTFRITRSISLMIQPQTRSLHAYFCQRWAGNELA